MANDTLVAPEVKASRYEAMPDLGDQLDTARELAGPPSSIFWCFHDFRARGRFNVHVPVAEPDVVVNAVSQIAASITELTPSGVPHLGNADMWVMNVVPNDDNTLLVRGRVDWDDFLPVRLNMIIVN